MSLASGNGGAPSSVVFVVPVLNRARALTRCLRAIRGAQGGDSAPIVVVDGGSTDSSPSVAETEGAVLLHAEGLRIAELRNRGAARAAGEVIVFIDSDVEIEPDWVQLALSALAADRAAAAVGGLKTLPESSGWVRRAFWTLQGFPAEAGRVRWLRSGCFAIRREAFEQVGGFDSELEACEDQDLCQRLERAGWKVLFDPRLRWHHAGEPETLGRIFRGELWRGRDNLRTSLKRPLKARELPSAAYPLVQLALAIAAIAATLLPGGMRIALGAGGLLVLLALARTAYLAHRAAHRPTSFAALLLVSSVHDWGRALALVLRSPYPRGRDAWE